MARTKTLTVDSAIIEHRRFIDMCNEEIMRDSQMYCIDDAINYLDERHAENCGCGDEFRGWDRCDNCPCNACIWERKQHGNDCGCVQWLTAAS
jgi:hypothetical protein